ncbi:hypothetical protein CS022_04265 [Veronia nyctiphanis]|uniref:Uncharacterized protein n=1 Tax=Veronia nyctiphanis TaxID=1278244 RepID=A0A4Q0YT14_9GAMM|nr:DUF3334 family protein [Veronia nyctiphanis]RXJ74390.1 hypothetical protein CS022_04265 [Veronia nyctiphanis]
MTKKTTIVTSDDILLKLCQSVTDVLTMGTNSEVTHSGFVQKIEKTSLKPDIGCFVLFDGGFSGWVVINFEAKAALEIYQKYMLNMGIPKEELTSVHTSDEVGDVLGELMNQMLGDFSGKIQRSLHISITQNQPKMMAFNKKISVTIDGHVEHPESRRVCFHTEDCHNFFLEFAVEATEFIQLETFKKEKELDPDAILEEEMAKHEPVKTAKPAARKRAPRRTSKSKVS